MFGFFRRRPSAYAVAIRDSMIRDPEKWTLKDFCCNDNLFVNGNIEIRDGEYTYLWKPRYHPTAIDRRCIREGIEAWIAHQVTT